MFKVVLSVLKLMVASAFLIAWSDLIIHGQFIVYMLMILGMILFSALQKRTVYRMVESVLTIVLAALLVIMNHYGFNLETNLAENISFNTACWVMAILVTASCFTSLMLDIKGHINTIREADVVEREESN